MTIHVKQMGGRSGGESTSEANHALRFDAWDDSTRWPDLETLYTSVANFAPTTFLGLAPVRIDYQEADDNGHTEFTVTYGSGEPAESLLRVGFDSTGGTMRATTSLATSSHPRSGRTAPDYKGAVEVVHNAPQGVDVVMPALKLVFRYKWPKGVLNINDTIQLAALTGKVNSSSWYGFAAGELLFLGASGELDLTTPTEVQYTFVASPNRTYNIGTWITGIQKKGHEHLWVAFEDFEDTSSKKRVQIPLAAYVETMYLDADFATLGIGS